MKVLFLARHHTYFRNFDSVIEALAARGHQVHLATEKDEALGGRGLVEAMAARAPGVTFGEAPGREADSDGLARKVRLSIDYLRYMDPPYDRTPALRARAAERIPQGLDRFFRTGIGSARPVRGLVRAALRAGERALPPSRRIEAYLREQAPDVLLLTPLIGLVASPQLDYLLSARALGIPTALCVWSWDHLSSKALIRDVPDRVVVWNDTQKDEAVRMHGVPADRVVVTGAQCFDRWFDRAPSRAREAFCARAGLPDTRPFLLYVCSALFRGSPSEADFVMRWIAHLRASPDPRLREAAVLVRPHPQRLHEWEGLEPGRFPHVALWGSNPVDEDARADYFDSLHHSAAVVGLNTSAFLEAGVVGRPVHAILLPEFRENQEGTIHFHYLTTVGGGLLRLSRSFEELDAQLSGVLAGEPGAPSGQAFVRAFIRPHGLDAPATPRLADAVEQLAATASARAPHGASFGTPSEKPPEMLQETGRLAGARQPIAGRAVLGALTWLDGTAAGHVWLMDRNEMRGHLVMEEKRARAADRIAVKAAQRARKAGIRRERERQGRDKLSAWRREKRARNAS
ncbi:MAG: hypothetical protein AB7G23_10075 [Vicinamibacterales bacterium]